jgi:cytoskeletal protein CcmA (bactofilin family)
MGKKPVEIGQIGGMLGDGVVMEGTLTFSQTFRVDGEFKGKVLRSDRLVVGEKGKVNGEIEVNSLVVYGRVDGQVKVKGSVEVHPKGRIVGELEMSSPNLSVMEGGFLEGTLKMSGAGQPGDGRQSAKPGNSGGQPGQNNKQGGKS